MLSDKEKQLIVKLRKNSRVNIKEVANEFNYPVSTMYDLLHKLEEKGIVKYTGKISFEKIGYPVHVFMIIKTTPENRNKLREYLTEKKNINALHTINHRTDFHLECIFSHQREVEEFLEELEEQNILTEINVYTVIETLQSDKFLSETGHFGN